VSKDPNPSAAAMNPNSAVLLPQQRAPAGYVKNILAIGVSVPEINDIFTTHLHVDHYHDLSYLLPFSAWAGRWKQPLPEFLFNYTVDIHHTLAYASGYLINQVNPRCGMVTHLSFDNDTLNEQSADVRAHWDGPFLYGASDVAVVNATKAAIWHRMAALPGFTGAQAGC